ncbi:MAG: CIA30 family protein [Acidobacteria bacterium]|nr:CIA30 family protein [Acidobacteriota bacterium]
MKLLLFLLTGWLVAAQPPAPPIAIVGATVVDGTGARPAPADVLIRGERIEAAGVGLAIPPNARIIRAEGYTLLPGLFDLHTHLAYSATSDLAGDWGKNLKAYLYCGVTSVIDVGTYVETFEPMRRLIRDGVIAAPRIALAARITTPGGHGSEGGRGDLFSQEVLTAREGRSAIRRALAYKPDVIKVFTDGWRYGFSDDMTSMRESTLAAIVEEAHAHKLPVITHTVTLKGAKIAARSDVDILGHGIGDADADRELMDVMKRVGMTYVSTLAVYDSRKADIGAPLLAPVLEPGAELPAPPDASEARTQRWNHLLRNIAALRDGGVAIGAGTDSGETGAYHGWATLRELQLMVEGGLTPLGALTAATGTSARALRVDAERGTIAAGKLADLVLVEGAPHLRISDIFNVRRVFLGGKEIDREAMARAIAAPAMTPIPEVKATAKIDDFESANGRSTLDTLWINATDAGLDHTKMLYGRTLRSAREHAYTVMARMSDTDAPEARAVLPLAKGAVEPVDASAFRGIRCEARGEGKYRLIVPTRGVRDFDYYASAFPAGARWKSVKIPFADLHRTKALHPAAWTGRDLLMLQFELVRPATLPAWLEIDNLRFYR